LGIITPAQWKIREEKALNAESGRGKNNQEVIIVRRKKKDSGKKRIK